MAQLGHDVVGIDVDLPKVEALQLGKATFYEPGFDDLLTASLSSGRLTFSADVEAARDAQVHFVCVGTPQKRGEYAADLRYVEAAVESLVPVLRPGTLVVGKSTVPVGTAARLAELITDKAPGAMLAWNPEFLREGLAVHDTLQPDRLVYGLPEGDEADRAHALLDEVYSTIVAAGTPKVVTDYATAEMVKTAANSFLATKISFINAMAELCEATGADVKQLADAIGYDDRIGRKFLNAGLGFGGGCLPKDIRAFSARAGELGASDALTFLREIDKINMRRRDKVVSVAGAMLGGDFLSKSIAVLGAAFKPNSDDVRDSPALNVAAAMYLKGAAVQVHDPKAMPNARRRFPTLTYCQSAEDACRKTDLIVLATEWDEYRNMDPHPLLSIVREPRLLDARNAVDHEFWTSAGWQVYALGRGTLNG
jgi:UDPglucose 6-dehydrogenase